MPPPARYQPARALPSHAYLPGRTPRPERDSREDSPHATLWDEYLWGADLYNHGYFWEAHEAWEALWRGAQHDGVRRMFLKGLIQCAAACLKGLLGDVEACGRLATRGLAQLQGIPLATDGRFMGLSVASFVAEFRAFAARQPLDVARRPLLDIRQAESD
jgi:hypothetical protein